MAIIKLTLFFCLFNLIISENIYLCLVPLIWGADFDKDMQICALKATKDDPDQTKNILSTFKQPIIEGIQDQLTEDNLASLNYIVEDFFNDKNNSLTSLFNIMKNNETLIEYLVDILNNNKVDNQTDLIFKYIVPIINIEGFDNLIM